MSTFLQLVQKAARESGTVQGVQPASVVGQSGRLLKFVNWTADAWTRIQNHRNAWAFLRADLPATAVASIGTGRYTAASWNIADLAAWITDEHSVTIYAQAVGVSDETEIRNIDWQTYRRLYERGVQVNQRPSHYAISPAGEFCLGPLPDVAYVVNGEYRRAPQTLAANTDIPICPARFHDAIAWLAVLTAIEHDEAEMTVAATANAKYREFMDALERDQLPQITIGAVPLA